MPKVSRLLCLAGALALTVPLSGCAGRAHGHSRHPHSRGRGDATFIAIELVAGLIGAAIQSSSSSAAETYTARADWESPRGWSPAADPPPASTRTSTSTSNAGFDLGSARSALAELDLGSCRDRGVPHGYIRASTTFEPGGSVSAVYVDGAESLPAEALACVDAAVRRATVSPFRGAAVTLRTTWFVN